ncbi:hypothetical protein SS50377_25963 [Spironucleus salmonicida]|uniref:Uncharacterized protein n=1 Tax=Spironucleus salmonicida TaxID=348837 RepID=V6LRU4_9EUKA|nr:hypothetical protein SS50377_25963 [Spironucleus salmonicida]|eukprot:EST47295.1 Hypothetical protein SS50377_12642 [Spironucleus salmonicida]
MESKFNITFDKLQSVLRKNTTNLNLQYKTNLQQNYSRSLLQHTDFKETRNEIFGSALARKSKIIKPSVLKTFENRPIVDIKKSLLESFSFKNQHEIIEIQEFKKMDFAVLFEDD